MSKIIKARFIIEDNEYDLELKGNSNNTGLNNHSLTLQADSYEEPITPETAKMIYNETKDMIEELMEDAQEQADKLILQAKADAQAVLEKAQASAEELKETARQEGYDQGYREGFERSSQEANALTQQFHEFLGKIIQDKEAVQKKYEKDIVELVLMLTEKLVGTVVQLRPEIMQQIIEKILVEASENEKVTVKVNPLHLPYLIGTEEQAGQSQNSKIQFIEDPALQPGDCIIQTDNGFIEAKIDDQLAILRETILDVTGHAGD